MTAVAEQWVERHDVPVYDSHVIVDKDTGREFPVTRERLQRIADRMNKHYRETGDETPIVVGHTKDGKPGDVPEWEQPPIVGLACEYYVEDHPGTKRPMLYARNWKLYPESKIGGEKLTADEVMRYYPRRSSEVWLSHNDVDPISILGATTPQQRLGLIRNARPVRYARGTTMEMPEFLQALQALIGQAGGGVAPPDPPVTEVSNDPNDNPLKYAAGTASGTNGTLPDAELERVKMQRTTTDAEKVRLERDQLAIQKHKLEERLAAVEQSITDDRIKYQRIKREGDFKQMIAEGYPIDIAEELDVNGMAELPEEKYQPRLASMKKNYARVPTGGGFVQTARLSESAPKSDAVLSERAMQYATTHNADFSETLAKMRNGSL